jgi:hypothetical protein
MGCGHQKLYEPKDYYAGTKNWEKRFAEDQGRDSWVHVVDGKILIDEHSDRDARSCPQLVALVEEMGDAANGTCARLRIVDIPEDIGWHIDEYDGIERAAENHRTW